MDDDDDLKSECDQLDSRIPSSVGEEKEEYIESPPPAKRQKNKYQHMKKVDLKQLCVNRKLYRSGNKSVLIKRLLEFDNNKQS